MQYFTSHLAGLIGIAALSALAALAAPAANAQQGAGAGIPVLVIIDDEARFALKRSTYISRRFLAELAGAMPRHGLRMVDAESVAGDLGWRLRDRTPRPELLEAVEEMGESHEAEHFHRASLLLQLRVMGQQRTFAVVLSLQVDGEVRAVPSTHVVDAIEIPPMTFPAPADCMSSMTECINGIVGDRTKGIARDLAVALARVLQRHPGVQPRDARSGWYLVTLRNFSDGEALTILGVMSEEFPGFRSVELVRKSPGRRTYEYLTTATAAKLDEWLGILLRDMGFDTDGEVAVTVDGAEIVIEKASPAASGDASGDASSWPETMWRRAPRQSSRRWVSGMRTAYWYSRACLRWGSTRAWRTECWVHARGGRFASTKRPMGCPRRDF